MAEGWGLAKYYGQTIHQNAAFDSYPTRRLVGGGLMRGSYPRQVHWLQDTVVSRSRRVVWRGGLRGSNTWLADNGPHASDGTQDLPLHDERREIAL